MQSNSNAIVAISRRAELVGANPGFIALTGAMSIVLVAESMVCRLKKPELKEVLQDLDWRAILFDIGLLAVAGGFEKMHLPKDFVDSL